MNDGLILIDKLDAAASAARAPDDLAVVWTSFDAVAVYCEIHRAADEKVAGELVHLKTGLSKFATDIREGALSPYFGYRVALTALRRHLDYDVDKDGWPKSPRPPTPLRGRR